jgi:DNA polymerase-3 subunit alpha
MSAKFTHLHTHSHYSLLEALPQVGDLVKHAKTQGAKALALTDNGNMFGTIEFVQECQKAEIKPIIGYDAFVAVDTIDQKRHRIDDKNTRLVLLAETMEGYKNLLKLASVAYLEGFYYRPRIDRNLLRAHAKGLIALAGGRSDIGRALENGEEDKATARLKDYLEIFGPEHFFIELLHQPDNPTVQEANAALLKLARVHGVGVVASRNVYYLRPEQSEARKLLLCIKDGRTLEERERAVEADDDLSMAAPEAIEEGFKDLPEAIENNAMIAERCEVKLDLGKWNFPVYPIPDGLTADQYLRKLSFDGLKAILKRDLSPEETERLDYELGIVEKKGYATYFLVVADYASWARSKGIISTTRGSAAGSLMGFAIGISTVNPLDFKLPFERFLNPLRPSAPDIDMDFADHRRGEVLQYVKDRYGVDRVAQICTFGTMAARASVRDVGRALGYPVGFCDQLSKMIPLGAQGFPMTIDRALDETPEFKERYDKEPEVRRLLDLARQVEGNARHCSVHAAGVVISDKPLVEYAPLQREAGGEAIITQYDMNSVEAAGVLKMDFLGIRNLSILEYSIDIVRRTKGVEVDLVHMDWSDRKTFEMLAAGKTMGLFQLNGDGMTKWLVQLKPTDIHDIMAMIALFRPGPMEVIPDFIRRKQDPSLVTYLDPRMKEYLGMSHGLLVYQDDILLTAIHIAGYDWLEADALRKAMGKKIPEVMAKQEAKFKEGCVKNGTTAAMADRLWNLFTPFAAYGFNKAHAASYAVVAYQTAYMKANFPAEFMTALMTAEYGDLDTVADAVLECRSMGIEVLPPDVNSSEADFTYIDDAHIRFGLNAVKNLGEDTIATVIAERKAGGPFKDLADFAARVHGKAFNKKSLEALAKSGALDALGERNLILENLDVLLTYNKNVQKELSSGQSNLFAFVVPAAASKPAALSLRPVPPASLSDVLAWEKELLGLYVTAHPFGELAGEFGALLSPLKSLGGLAERAPVRVGGTVTSVKKILTKKSNEPMLFVTITDPTGDAEVVVFPSVLKEHPAVWQEGANLAVTGRVSRKDDEAKILADKGWPLTPETVPAYKSYFKGEKVSADDVLRMNQRSKVKGQQHGEVHLLLPAKLPAAAIASLKTTLAKYPGSSRVCLLVRTEGQPQRLETSYLIEPTSAAVQAIEKHIGLGNVKIPQGIGS